jgi:tellurite resistance protein TehA-like permease
MNIGQYGLPHTGPWLRDTLVILFWIYYILAIICSCGLYLVLWNTQRFNISEMTPSWIFPAYPLLLIAPIATVLTGVCSQPVGWLITIGAITLQGVGFLVSLMIYSAFVHRLMTHKLPAEAVRPGMFVSVGPSGFTAAGLLGVASDIAGNLPPEALGKGDQELLANVLYIMMQWTSLCIWGLAIWFFIISVGAHVIYLLPGTKRLHIRFNMNWYSFIFPNTALVVATLEMGRAFTDNVLKIFGTFMAILLVLLWMFVFIKMLRAVLTKQILWPVDLEAGANNDDTTSSVSNIAAHANPSPRLR